MRNWRKNEDENDDEPWDINDMLIGIIVATKQDENVRMIMREGKSEE